MPVDGSASDCADLVRFLAYGGFRRAKLKTSLGTIAIFSARKLSCAVTRLRNTKNSEIRRVPMIAEMRQLLEGLREKRPKEPATARVMRVTQCELAMKRAEKKAGIAHLTHHDLRHLFATRCIESGVDIPTVSRWLGHKDGGGLAMKVYGHLRNQHSASMAKLVNFQPTNVVPLRQAGAA